MVTGFLLFNLLAFFNNILELAGEHSDSFTILIELSTLLVNLNGATTIIIYLTFGSKYRTVFLKCAKSILQCLGCSKLLRQNSTEKLIPNEQTFLIVSSQADIIERRRQTLKIISQQSFGSA
uniref:G-protein coupled receptors family 1 profile domain-containing protein n=1 Tax=Panagrolaimus sp. PS1159 TaxID=55785 RepID=A0AC35F684_9BILA